MAQRPALKTSVAAMLAALLLAACGGGDEPATATPAQAARPQALAAAAAEPLATSPLPNSVDTEQLFRWAQLTYPDLFPDSPPIVQIAHEGKTFEVRAYANGNHLGVANGEAYGLGPFTGGALQNFGSVTTYSSAVCAKLGCGTGPDAAAVNAAVTVGAPQPSTITGQVMRNGRLAATSGSSIAISGTVGGDIFSLAGATLYVIVEDPSSLFESGASVQIMPGDPWRYQLLLQPRALPTAGRFTGTLRAFACTDPACNTRLGGTPLLIPYDVTVRN